MNFVYRGLYMKNRSGNIIMVYICQTCDEEFLPCHFDIRATNVFHILDYNYENDCRIAFIFDM